MKKDETIMLRLSAEEHDAFRAAASAVGLTLSQWLRTLARRGAGLPTLGEEGDRK